jgi:eukaryotic-like serine/threonine-protein kinase
LSAELARLAERAPLLFLATTRPDPDPGVSALEKTLESALGPRFQRLELSALSNRAERQLAQWLVGRAAGEDILAAVRKDAEGNPLFLEERFSTLVETGALVKAGSRWSLAEVAANEVPDVLERLVRSRVDRLPPLAKKAVVAASVLGPEFALSALGSITDIGERLPEAVAELCRARLLVEVGQVPEPGYRFRHAMIQEATYGGLLRSQRANLHARAAWGLEAGATGQIEDVAAVLGHHYAMAGERDRAVHFLWMAARHAAAQFAIDEAVCSYRRALDVLERGRQVHGQGHAAIELRAELGDVLWRTTRLAEAREVLSEALALVGPDQNLLAARLYTRLGRVEVESGFQGDTESCHLAALAAFDTAEELLGPGTEGRSDEWVGIWLELLIDGRTNLHNWRSEPELAARVLARARAVAEVRGSPSRRSGLFVQLASQGIVQRGGAYDEETVNLTRRGVQAAQDGGDEHDLALCFTALGEALLNNGKLAEADEMLKKGLTFGERVDDPQSRSWCLAVRCLLDVRRHNVDAVRLLSRQARSAATTATMPLWQAAATATEAWLAWKDNRYEDVIRLSGEALDLWRTVKFAHSLGPIGLKAVCLWPLVSVHLASGHIADAVDAGSQLLDAPDIRSPDEVQSLLSSARAAWDSGDGASAASGLNVAVVLASRLGCC